MANTVKRGWRFSGLNRNGSLVNNTELSDQHWVSRRETRIVRKDARKFLLIATAAATATVLCVSGIVYVGSADQFWLSKSRSHVTRIVLPSAQSLQGPVARQRSHADAERPGPPGAASGTRMSSPVDRGVQQGGGGRTAANGQITIAPIGARLRAGPGFDRAKIMVVKGGAKLQIVDQQGQWLEVRFPSGRQGFVHASLVEVP